MGTRSINCFGNNTLVYQMSSESLINVHRPTKFNQIIGQNHVVSSFKTALEYNTSHAFLFTGPAGCGKTTLARIGAKYVGTTQANLIEIDAATHNGVDDVRNLTVSLGYRPLGKNSTKSLIIDEAHSISKSGWQAFLKSVEEPPDWVYFFFVTTDIGKVPDTIKSRCASYILNPVRITEIMDFLLDIVEKEKFDTPRTIIELCAKQSDGSPRKALSNLAVCYASKDRAEAAKLIALVEITEGGAAYAIARAIADGWKWNKIQPLLNTLSESEESPETIRHVIRSYFTKIIIGTDDEKVVCKALKVLDSFSEPYNSADGMSPLVISIGRSLF